MLDLNKHGYSKNIFMIKEFRDICSGPIGQSCLFSWEDHGGLGSLIDSSVESFKKNKLIIITRSIRKPWWENFISQIISKDLDGVIMVDHLPDTWIRPDNCVLVNHLQAHISRNLDNWLKCKNSLLPLQFKRKINQINYSFFSAVGSGYEDPPRLIFSRLLELLGVADRALISRAEVKESQLNMAPDPWVINGCLSKPAALKRFDNRPVLMMGGRKKWSWEYSQEENNDVIAAIQQCHFALSFDNNFSWPDGNGYMSEKMLFPLLAGVPCIWLANDHKKNLLKDWGFEDSSDGLFIPSVDNLYGWVAAISVLERLVMDSASSQGWQDAQGERVYNNYKSLWKLSDRLHDLQWQQWQKIKNII
jgi:hypothetical protein